MQLKEALRRVKGVRFNWHDARLSMLEAVFARGDRRLANVLVRAYEAGCRFDSWKENFDFGKWQSAFEEAGVDPKFYAARERDYDEVLPWDRISAGLDKAFLWREKQLADDAATTVDCRQQCHKVWIFPSQLLTL